MSERIYYVSTPNKMFISTKAEPVDIFLKESVSSEDGSIIEPSIVIIKDKGNDTIKAIWSSREDLQIDIIKNPASCDIFNIPIRVSQKDMKNGNILHTTMLVLEPWDKENSLTSQNFVKIPWFFTSNISVEDYNKLIAYDNKSIDDNWYITTRFGHHFITDDIDKLKLFKNDTEAAIACRYQDNDLVAVEFLNLPIEVQVISEKHDDNTKSNLFSIFIALNGCELQKNTFYLAQPINKIFENRNNFKTHKIILEQVFKDVKGHSFVWFPYDGLKNCFHQLLNLHN